MRRGSVAIRIAGTTLVLTRQEWALLKALASEVGRAFRREELIRRAWGLDLYVTHRTVDVHVASLRRKIQATSCSGCCIETVWGFGYRLRLDNTPPELGPAPTAPPAA